MTKDERDWEVAVIVCSLRCTHKSITVAKHTAYISLFDHLLQCIQNSHHFSMLNSKYHPSIHPYIFHYLVYWVEVEQSNSFDLLLSLILQIFLGILGYSQARSLLHVLGVGPSQNTSKGRHSGGIQIRCLDHLD